MTSKPHKICPECSLSQHTKAVTCKGCGYGFYNEKPPASQKKTVLTYGFLKRFRKELDHIKQTPPQERKHEIYNPNSSSTDSVFRKRTKY